MLKMQLQFFADDEEEKEDNVDTPEPTESEPVTPTEPEVTAPAENDIATMLLDIQGLLANMQQSLDKLAPVEGAGETAEEAPGEEAPSEEAPTEEPSEEEVQEIDKILQED